MFLALRSTYFALCEMESDFEQNLIFAFNKTVGTYAGLSREAAGKYVKRLEEESLIKKIRVIDPDTHLKSKGTYLQIISAQEFLKAHPELEEEERVSEKAEDTARFRVSRYPNIRTSEHSDTPALLKKIRIRKKVSGYKNVKKKNVKEKENDERSTYYAELIADKLGDRKSLTYYKLMCRRYHPEWLHQKAQEIVTDGGAKNPAAVFVAWLKNEHAPPASPDNLAP